MIRFISRSPTISVSSGGNLTLGEPAGAIQNDLLVASISYRDAATFAVPAGWSLIAQNSGANTLVDVTGSISGSVMAFIIRGVGAPSFVFTRTGGNMAMGHVTCYRGVDTSSPLVAFTNATLGVAASDASFALPSSDAAGQLFFSLFAGARNADTIGAVSSNIPMGNFSAGVNHEESVVGPLHSLEVVSRNNTVAGADGSICVVHGLQPNSGAGGTITFSSANSARHSCITAVFRSSRDDDRVYTDTSRLNSIHGFIRNGISTRIGRLYTASGFIDNGIASRVSRLYAIIDPNLPDIRRNPPRRIISNKVAVLQSAQLAEEFAGNFITQDGEDVFTTQSGNNFLTQMDVT